MKPPRYFSRYSEVEKIVNNLHFESVFELGYGDGYMISHLGNAETRDKFGYEISSSAKRSAKENFKKFQVQDLDLPPSKSSIDLFMAFETIGYFDDTSVFFDIAFNALKDGGMLILSATPPRGENEEESISGMRVFTDEFLICELENKGFDLVLVKYYGGVIINSIHKCRGVFRKVIRLDSQEVEQSWRDPFDSKTIQMLYLFVNVIILPFDKLLNLFFNTFSGYVILARKVLK